MRKDMHNVGLTCEDTSPENLEKGIESVRSVLSPSPLQSFMIAGRIGRFSEEAAQLGVDVRQVLSAGLTDGAHEVVDAVADADPKVQNLLWILGSKRAGTRAFVEELIVDDRAGQELFSALNAPDKSARSFIEQLVAGSGRGGRIADWVASFESPAVSLLARLAQLDQEPLAVTTWTPDPLGAITGPYMTMLGNIQYPANFEKIKQRYKDKQLPFPGITTKFDPGKKQMKTSNLIIEFFKNTCQGVVTTVAKAVDKKDLEALITTYIEPQTSGDDYVMEKDRFIYLAQNYNAQDQTADGVGIVSLHYNLTVKAYRQKDKYGGDTHDVTLPMTARGIQYPGAIGFSNLCLDNRYVTGSCESCCQDAKTWYEQNPLKGKWPADNKECPPVS
ncbi:hypothetical protein AB0C76_39740 [Kitasatospora sp. NPDC048722]|uniref:hypothetical protein n=1 Tax=Kitasatospora sp. NPDC048722 TaxID=3155639 RepID=UPI0033D4F3C0